MPKRSDRPSTRTVRAYRRRRQARHIAVVLLALLGLAGLVPDVLRALGGPITPRPDAAGRPTPPAYAFSLPRTGDPALLRPLSVTVADDRVYVGDSLAGLVAVFRIDGAAEEPLGETELEVPLYLAANERVGELYVTDRALSAVLAFDLATGSFVETITPSLETTPVPDPLWAPLAVDVADDGTLYVTDVSGPHRVWHLARDGEVLGVLPRSAEETGAPDAGDGFDYPNAVKALGGRVWIADSNNRRLVEFDGEGEQVRSLPLGRLVRGFDVVMAEPGAPVYFALADAFSHQVVLVSESGSEVARLGEPGGAAGQLAFPNDVAVAGGVAWIADTGNARVQAWEWDGAARAGMLTLWPGGPGLLAALSAFLLFGAPLLLLFDLRAVTVAVSGPALPALRDLLAGRRARWGRVRLVAAPASAVVPEAFPGLPPLEEREISRPDVSIVGRTYGLDPDQAETLTLALRTRSLLTGDPTLQVIGRARGLDVYDARSFAEEFLLPGETEGRRRPPRGGRDGEDGQDSPVPRGT